jgi:hypothetical protein
VRNVNRGVECLYETRELTGHPVELSVNDGDVVRAEVSV